MWATTRPACLEQGDPKALPHTQQPLRPRTAHVQRRSGHRSPARGTDFGKGHRSLENTLHYELFFTLRNTLRVFPQLSPPKFGGWTPSMGAGERGSRGSSQGASSSVGPSTSLLQGPCDDLVPPGSPRTTTLSPVPSPVHTPLPEITRARVLWIRTGTAQGPLFSSAQHEFNGCGFALIIPQPPVPQAPHEPTRQPGSPDR